MKNGLGLRAEGVGKSYGASSVLAGLSREFPPGASCAIMGANGSGKSTLLRILSLLEPADSGGVFYSDGDGPLPGDIRLRRRITLLLPDIGLFNCSVLKNASYGLSIRGMNGSQAKARGLEALARVGLEHKARQNALTLSSGEAQRLALARAIAIGPDVLFLDEPTVSLDAENRALIEEAILAMRGKTSIILTTHDIRQAEKLADTVLELRGGALIP